MEKEPQQVGSTNNTFTNTGTTILDNVAITFALQTHLIRRCGCGDECTTTKGLHIHRLCLVSHRRRFISLIIFMHRK